MMTFYSPSHLERFGNCDYVKNNADWSPNFQNSAEFIVYANALCNNERNNLMNTNQPCFDSCRKRRADYYSHGMGSGGSPPDIRRYERAMPISLTSSGAIVVLKQFRKYPQQGKYAGHSEGAGELLQRQAASPEVCEGEISQVLPPCCCQTVHPAVLPIDLTLHCAVQIHITHNN